MIASESPAEFVLSSRSNRPPESPPGIILQPQSVDPALTRTVIDLPTMSSLESSSQPSNLWAPTMITADGHWQQMPVKEAPPPSLDASELLGQAPSQEMPPQTPNNELTTSLSSVAASLANSNYRLFDYDHRADAESQMSHIELGNTSIPGDRRNAAGSIAAPSSRSSSTGFDLRSLSAAGATSSSSKTGDSTYFLGTLAGSALTLSNYFLPLWVLAFVGTVICGLVRSASDSDDATFQSAGVAFGNFAFCVSYLPQACFHFATAMCLRQLLRIPFGENNTRVQCERIHGFSGDWNSLDRVDLGLILVPAAGSVTFIVFQIYNFIQSSGGALNAVFYLSLAVHVSCMFQLGAFCLVVAKRILYMLQGVVDQIPAGVVERSRLVSVTPAAASGFSRGDEVSGAATEGITFLFSGTEYDKIAIDAETIFQNCALFLNLGMWDVSFFWFVSIMSISKTAPTALGFLRFVCFSWCVGTMMFFFVAANKNYYRRVQEVLRKCRLHTSQATRSDQIGGGCLFAFQYMGMHPIQVKIFSVPVTATLLRGYAVAALSTVLIAYQATILRWINSGVF